MDFKAIALQIQGEIGIDRAIIKPLVNGIQAKLPNFDINFYYGQKGYKFVRSDNNFSHSFDRGQESNEILRQLSYIKKSEKVLSKPTNVIELNDKGTQACIDHIQRKIKTFDKIYPKKEDSAVRSMLLNLTMELTQYL